METPSGTALHCNDKLRSKLHSDDTEKLRRKLAFLQREYLKTEQRLKRAERSDAVRSGITEQNSLNLHRNDSDYKLKHCPNLILPSASVTLDSPSRTNTGLLQDQKQTEGQVESDNCRKNTVGILLPSDGVSPLTPASSRDPARDQRPSSALRLCSRSSRLRRQKRRRESAEVGVSTDNSEEGHELIRNVELTCQKGKTRVEAREVDKAQEGKELLTSSDSESPSLLLTHWNAVRRTAEACMEQKGHVKGEKVNELTGDDNECESPSLLRTHWTSSRPAEGGAQEAMLDRQGKARGGGLVRDEDADADADSTEKQMGKRVCETKSDEGGSRSTNEKNTDTTVCLKGDPNEEQSIEAGGRCGDGGVSLRASGTLVEGLLFPPEYYVRTTRRMSARRSDIQAVLLSPYTGTRRNRGQSQRTHREAQCSNEKTLGQMLANRNEVNSCSISANPSARSGRGRKTKRGRSFKGASYSSNVTQPAQGHALDRSLPTSTRNSPLQSVPVVDGLEQGLESETPATVCVSESSRSPFAHNPTVPLSAGAEEPKSVAVPGSLEKVYPIFRSGSQTERPPHDFSSWRSLLLPSPLAPISSVLHLPPLAQGSVLKTLVNLDFQQDFLLPDDQFGSLKLHKLRQVVMETTEAFSASSYSTRRSSRHAYALYNSNNDQVLPLPPPFTPTSSNSRSSPHSGVESLRHLQSVSLPSPPTVTHSRAVKEQKCTGTQISLNSMAGPPEDQLSENGHGSQFEQSITTCSEHFAEKEPLTGTVTESVVEGFADHSTMGESSLMLTEKQGDHPGVVKQSDGGRSTDHPNEEKEVNEIPSTSDSPAGETFGGPFKCHNNCQPIQTCKDSAKQEKHLTNVTDDPSALMNKDRLSEGPLRGSPCPGACSQLLLSPSLASPPFPIISPHRLSSALPSRLPSLGLTPHPLISSLPLPSSPSAPNRTLPSPVSPSSLAPSPPLFFPCPSVMLPHCSPSPASDEKLSPLDPATAVAPTVAPSSSPTLPHVEPDVLVESRLPFDVNASSSAECTTVQAGKTEETEECAAPAGGGLVDACCVPGPSGGLCVAAAGKWAVCVWAQTSTSGWSLIHTWTFNKPVISVFSVPDAAGLLCVSLGQLEIQEVRMLSCSTMEDVLLCRGVVQAVVGVARSRVVCSSHLLAISKLQLFTLSDNNSAPTPLPLASPGMRVGTLATVDELADALLGSAERGHLFIWNLRTGQLLQRILLEDSLSYTVCLRGYSDSGLLFVLLQHQFLGSLVKEEVPSCHQEEVKENEQKRATLFSLVVINPLSGKSVLATRLHQPEAWRGRLCEADVIGSRLVGLSQSSSVYVWDLESPVGPRVVWAPEIEGWHIARWGGQDTLVTGHQNGDLTLYRYNGHQTFLKNAV